MTTLVWWLIMGGIAALVACGALLLLFGFMLHTAAAIIRGMFGAG